MACFRIAVCLVATAVLALAPPAHARTDTRAPLAETHGCEPIGRYCLQSNPWVNLHQRLLHEAQHDGEPPSSLAGDKLAEWKALVARYREHFGDRSAVFDRELAAIDAALATVRTLDLPQTLPKAPAAVLERAMPLYRQSQWKNDDRGNRFYIALAKPQLLQLAPEVIAAHEQAYGRPFPSRILVDVTGHAGRFGAYTVGAGDEAHVVQSHTTPLMHGFGILESLVHEPSHAIVARHDGAIGAELTRAKHRTRLEPPENLWHAMLFYTAGELTRRAYARRGIAYTPVIAHRYDGPFRGLRAPLEQHWQAFLDGKLERDEAVRRVLAETAQRP